MKKSHKTPWGKVKNIIQTRKDSLKKRQRKGETEAFTNPSAGAGSDHEDDFEFPEDMETLEENVPDTELCKTHIKPRIEVSALPDTKEKRRDSQKHHHCHQQQSPSRPQKETDPDRTGKRLTPTLTITLPSTEELTNVPDTSHGSASSANSAAVKRVKPPPSPQTEERLKLEHRTKHGVSGVLQEDGAEHVAATPRRRVCKHILYFT